LPQAGAVEGDLQISDGGQALWHGDNQLYLWDHGTVRQLTQQPYDVFFERMNDVGQVVWQARYVANPGIFFWDGTQVRQLSQENGEPANPQINHAGQVVWKSSNGQRSRIFLWDGHSVRPLSSDDAFALDPQINDAGQVVWFQSTVYGMGGIYRWNGSGVEKVVDTLNAAVLQLNGPGQIAWASGTNGLGGFGSVGGTAGALLLWKKGTLQQIAAGGGYSNDWRLNDTGQVVWQGWDGRRVSLYRWDGAITEQLPSDARFADSDDWDFNDRGQVVWRQPVSGRLLLWEGGAPRILARSGASSARINAGGQVVWRGRNGAEGEIYLSSPLDRARYGARPRPGSAPPPPAARMDGQRLRRRGRGAAYFLILSFALNHAGSRARAEATCPRDEVTEPGVRECQRSGPAGEVSPTCLALDDIALGMKLSEGLVLPGRAHPKLAADDTRARRGTAAGWRRFRPGGRRTSPRSADRSGIPGRFSGSHTPPHWRTAPCRSDGW
jgi:hypothetical protein